MSVPPMSRKRNHWRLMAPGTRFPIERWSLIVQVQSPGQIDLSNVLLMKSAGLYPLDGKRLPPNIKTLSSWRSLFRDSISGLRFLRLFSFFICRYFPLQNRHWHRLIIIFLPAKLPQQRRSTARLLLIHCLLHGDIPSKQISAGRRVQASSLNPSSDGVECCSVKKERHLAGGE